MRQFPKVGSSRVTNSRTSVIEYIEGMVRIDPYYPVNLYTVSYTPYRVIGCPRIHLHHVTKLCICTIELLPKNWKDSEIICLRILAIYGAKLVKTRTIKNLNAFFFDKGSKDEKSQVKFEKHSRV